MEKFHRHFMLHKDHVCVQYKTSTREINYGLFSFFKKPNILEIRQSLEIKYRETNLWVSDDKVGNDRFGNVQPGRHLRRILQNNDVLIGTYFPARII